MSWTNRIVWQEGMFLRSQHFQQQDRWLEAFARGRAAALRPYPWGLTQFALDKELLATGRFAAAAAAGVFEDGTPFALPGETDHPPPLDVPETARGVLVHLAVPIRQPGAVEIAPADNSAEGRYRLASFEAYDTHSASPQTAELLIGRLKLKYLFETDDRAGYLCLPLARILEVTADKRVILDEGWMPPALLCNAVAPLAGLIIEFFGIVNQRGESLAARVNQPGTRGAADVQDFLLLQTINRWHAVLGHWSDTGNLHPETLYTAFVQMAAEFATFAGSRRPGQYPGYRHEDLQRSFTPVVADLRRALAFEAGGNAIAIPLEERRPGIHVGIITDRNLLRAAFFVLSVRADMPSEQLRQLFAAQVKIGAVEHIQKLVTNALPGIQIRPLPVAPRQIPFYAGASYFALDVNSPHWQQMQNSGAFAIHISGLFPNLQIELWRLRADA